MRVKFLERFVWSPPEHKGRTSIVYEADRTYTVRRPCGEEAIAAGKAEEVKSRGRDR
jgi:hypothetical protein